MGAASNHRFRTARTAIAVMLVTATIGCRQETGQPGEESTRVAVPAGPTAPAWACETHTTLAQMATPTEDELVAAVRGLTNREALTADSLDLMGITTALVGVRSVGAQDTVLTWRSPQYHDCQDLIGLEEGERRYVTRAGIMATIEPQTLQDAAFTADPSVGHRLAFVRRLGNRRAYPNLLLDRDSACVYVGAGQEDDINAPWWAAVIDCDGPKVSKTAIDSTRIINVTRLTYPNHHFSFTDYPPVARWEWDRAIQAQAYGVKCGTGWCVMGVAAPPADTTGYGQRPQEMIRGWRDEQYLAESTDSIPERGRPSDQYAVIVPSPQLGGITPDSLTKPNPVIAGFLQVVEGTSPRYDAKYGFNEHGRYPVRIGGGIRPGGPDRPDTTVVRIMHPTPDAGVTPPPPKSLNALIHPLDAPVVATARWAWSLDDEQQWWRCPDGCCETIGAM